MTSRGILIVVSGFSGAGKGTIIKELLRRYPEKYSLSISATTRKPRFGEVCGCEYFFKEMEEFEKMIAENQLIEYARYVGNYYGTPRDFVEEQLELGQDVILEIEVQGAKQVRELIPDALSIFIVPPSLEELERRLRGRGTDSEEKLLSRLERAKQELEEKNHYSHIVVNDEVDRAAKEILSILERK